MLQCYCIVPLILLPRGLKQPEFKSSRAVIFICLTKRHNKYQMFWLLTEIGPRRRTVKFFVVQPTQFSLAIIIVRILGVNGHSLSLAHKYKLRKCRRRTLILARSPFLLFSQNTVLFAHNSS